MKKVVVGFVCLVFVFGVVNGYFEDIDSKYIESAKLIFILCVYNSNRNYFEDHRHKRGIELITELKLNFVYDTNETSDFPSMFTYQFQGFGESYNYTFVVDHYDVNHTNSIFVHDGINMTNLENSTLVSI